MVPSTMLLASHYTDATTGTKNHVIPLNNYLNMMNAMMSLMAPSASYDRKNCICYISCTDIPTHRHTIVKIVYSAVNSS